MAEADESQRRQGGIVEDPSADRPGVEGAPGRTRALVSAFVVASLMFVATVLVALMVQDQIAESAQTNFEESVEQATAAVESEVAGYLDELHDVGSYVAHPGATPDAETFEAYVADTEMFDRLDPLVGILVLHRVPDRLYDDLVEDSTALGMPELTVIKLGETLPGEPHYILSYYVAEDVDLQLPIGTDVAPFISVTQAVMAAEAAESAIAGSFQDDPLLLELAEVTDFPAIAEITSLDFFIGVPVYADGDDRSVPPVAWVAAAVSDFDSVLAAATAGQPEDIGMQLTVNLTAVAVPDAEISRVAERAGEAGPVGDAAFEATREFVVDGMPWTLTVWGGPESGVRPYAAVLVLIAGLTSAVLAGLLIWVRTTGRAREQAFVLALRDREQLRRDILDSVTSAMVVLDGDGLVVATNPAWRDLRRPRQGETAPPDTGRHYSDVITELSPVGVWVDRALGAVLEDEAPAVEADLPVETRGLRRWYAVRFTPLHGSRGGAVIVHTDITDRKVSEAELAARANQDPLTGLLNRSAIEREVDRATARAAARGEEIAVLFIDLDGFKAVNDTYGHGVGDEVLREVSGRLMSAVRTSDRVARLGGDEFVVLITALRGSTDAESTARRVLDALEPGFDVAGGVSLGASIGIAVVDAGSGDPVGSLIELADGAMYLAKQQGGDRYQLARG